jgi:hypothetical protein
MQVNTIFSELLNFIPDNEFYNLAEELKGNYYYKELTGQQQFKVLFFSNPGSLWIEGDPDST